MCHTDIVERALSDAIGRRTALTEATGIHIYTTCGVCAIMRTAAAVERLSQQRTTRDRADHAAVPMAGDAPPCAIRSAKAPRAALAGKRQVLVRRGQLRVEDIVGAVSMASTLLWLLT